VLIVFIVSEREREVRRRFTYGGYIGEGDGAPIARILPKPDYQDKNVYGRIPK